MCTDFTKGCFGFLRIVLFTAGKRPTNYHQVFCLLPFRASSTPTPCSDTQTHQISLSHTHTQHTQMHWCEHRHTHTKVHQHSLCTLSVSFRARTLTSQRQLRKTHRNAFTPAHTHTHTHTHIPTRSSETVCEQTTSRERWRKPGLHSCWLLQERRGAKRLLSAPLTVICTSKTHIHKQREIIHVCASYNRK